MMTEPRWLAPGIRRVALVSCVKAKRSTAAPAGELYTSRLFQALRGYAVAHADSWFVLSAEHGLLDPGQVVSPYEKALNTMRRTERVAWANRVQHQLAERLPLGAEVLMLAGERYRVDLIPFLTARGHRISIPLLGLSIGKQLQWLKHQAESIHGAG